MQDIAIIHIGFSNLDQFQIDRPACPNWLLWGYLTDLQTHVHVMSVDWMQNVLIHMHTCCDE